MRGATFLALLVILIGLAMMVMGTSGQTSEVLAILKKA